MEKNAKIYVAGHQGMVGSAVVRCLEQIGHDNLLIRVTPYNESPVMFDFDIRGMSKAIGPLQNACGWK